MDYRDKLIIEIARNECKRICGKVIREVQRMPFARMSGDDSGLDNTWDEICVQVQGEESFEWDAYLESMRAIIASEVERLNGSTKQAIWLQTDAGMSWDTKDAEDENLNIPYSEDDIVELILHEYVLRQAANWTNKRIAKYLETMFVN